MQHDRVKAPRLGKQRKRTRMFDCAEALLVAGQ
jgi:hypothetical protein